MTRAARTISFKPTFLKELERLEAKHQAQVMSKIGTLATSPEPQAKVKKPLKGVDNGLHRLRSGDYRVFYAYDERSVSLFSVRIRSGSTYDSMPEVEELAHGDFDLDVKSGPTKEDYLKWISEEEEEERPLPEPITEDLLRRLEIPPAYHPRLVACEFQEALLRCPGVPEEYLLAIDEHMFEKPIAKVVEEPTLVAEGGVDDLLRFARGELVSFLLELDPEQEVHVAWSPEADGPTLIRGGPGTGKSTVALYRVREVIDELRRAGTEVPRVLFATYTNALVTFSEQLLRALLGEDVDLVDVRTVDSVVGSVLARAGEGRRRPDRGELTRLRETAIETAAFEGNALQQAAQEKQLGRLGREYVFEEIEVVIQGRGLERLEEYLGSARPGRTVPLDGSARRAVWAVHRAYEEALEEAGCETWQQGRARAAEIVARGESPIPAYDAVIVDETQDLDACAIRLLADLCARPSRLCITADEHQAIHAASFAWEDVKKRLDFEGRIGVLSTTHRSTREIIEGARDYLAAGLAEDLAPDPQRYVHSGPLPIVRAVEETEEEGDLLARYLLGATRELRFTIGSGAVLVPYNRSGRRVANALEDRGVPAAFRDSRSFELDDNTVKVLPLRAAKGLEFPVVAVAGFVGTGYPNIPEDADDDAHIDSLVRERRTLFVAMTRAMRALLVITPKEHPSMLFDGFDPELWNATA